MAGLLVITSQDESLGFRCAGVECMELGADADVSKVIGDIQLEAKYGLVVVEESLYRKVSENMLRRIRRKGLPIVVAVNIPKKWSEREFGESPVVRLIRKAIGYQIKIKR